MLNFKTLRLTLFATSRDSFIIQYNIKINIPDFFFDSLEINILLWTQKLWIFNIFVHRYWVLHQIMGIASVLYVPISGGFTLLRAREFKKFWGLYYIYKYTRLGFKHTLLAPITKSSTANVCYWYIIVDFIK